MVKESMEFVAKGKEGKVYRMGPFIFKMYRSGFPFEKMEREYKFLKKHKNTGVVPKVYSTKRDLRELGLIVMEDLKDYITLKKLIKNKKQYSKTQLLNLAKAMLRARIKIGKNTRYHDLHSENVMVKISGNRGYVRFIDPGEISDQHGAWIDWMEGMLRDMKMIQGPLGTAIKKKNVTKINSLIA